jgi:hypothetical protein
VGTKKGCIGLQKVFTNYDTFYGKYNINLMLTIQNYKKLKGQYIMTHSMTESWKILDVRENKSAYEIIIGTSDAFSKNHNNELTMKIGRERPDGASEYEYMITSIDIVIGVLNRCIIRIENIDTMDSMMYELKTIIEM